MKSFIAWIGGKHILASKIIALMPEHHCYVEVFGGGGSVLFRKQPSPVEVWNDLNSDLVNLFSTVRNRLDEFKSRQYFLLSSREEYYRIQRAMKGDEEFKSDIDRAIAFYYLIKNSFGSGIFTGWGFSPNRSPKHGISLEDLEAARERLKTVYIDNLPFERLIRNWDRRDTLFYCDPPYYMLLERKGRSYYQCTFDREDHTKLRDVLKGIEGKFILSYDDNQEIRKLYRRFNIMETSPVLYSMNNRRNAPARKVRELIITNFDVKKRLAA